MKTDQEHRRALRWFFAGAMLAATTAAMIAAMTGPGRAERLPLPGIGTEDGRVAVEAGAAPWRSLAKVQTNLGGRCTGVLVAPDRVVTAAHCLINPRTRRFLPPSSLHVLFGYDRGDYRVHATVAGTITGPGFDPSARQVALAADWAVLTLSAPVAVPPLPVSDPLPAAGTAVMLGGYSQDRAHVLTADHDCRVTGAGAGLLLHDCDATRGTSGGALLAKRGDGWAVVAIGVAAAKGEGHRNLAVPAAAFVRAIGENAPAHQP